MQLQHEFPRQNECRQLMGGHQLELGTNFGRLLVTVSTKNECRRLDSRAVQGA